MTGVVSRVTPPAEANATATVLRRNWQRTAAILAIALVGMLTAHLQTVYGTVAIWSRTQTYSFAWAVLPTLAYLVWHNRARLVQQVPSGSLFGVLVAGICAVAWFAGDLLNIAEAKQLALVSAIGAVVFAAVGWHAFRVLLPFLVLLVFLVPTGAFLVMPLKHLSITLVGLYASLAGLPFVPDGFAFFVGPQRYVVINDCAALPYLLVGLFTGLSLALLIYRRWWKITAAALFAGGLALLANGVRISSIITYDYVTGSELTLSQHEYFQWLAVALNFLILFAVFARLTPDSPPEKTSPVPRQAPARSAAPAVAAAVLVALVSLIGTDRSATSTDNLAIRQLPSNVSGWTKQDPTSDWHPRSWADATLALLSDYTRGGQRIAVFVAQPKTGQDKVSGGAIDLMGDTREWMPSSQAVISLCTEGRCNDVRYVRQLLRDSDRVRHVYSVFANGAELTTSVLQFRFRRAWARLTGESPRALMIAISTEQAEGLKEDEIAALLSALTT